MAGRQVDRLDDIEQSPARDEATIRARALMMSEGGRAWMAAEVIEPFGYAMVPADDWKGAVDAALREIADEARGGRKLHGIDVHGWAMRIGMIVIDRVGGR